MLEDIDTKLTQLLVAEKETEVVFECDTSTAGADYLCVRTADREGDHSNSRLPRPLTAQRLCREDRKSMR